jgi:SpoVK/Ycf46/Vps4 family AAA+-type ATPase
LLLDEADSFLRDRKNAQHSWEVTQVNELLTQMEEYQGLFICSTNLVDDLDAASIRRFDLKIKFDYMKPEQVCKLFRQVLKDQAVSFRMSPQWKNRISGFTNLTPGDFATVVRQNRMNQSAFSADLLHEGLLKESAFKEDINCRGIGFSANL